MPSAALNPSALARTEPLPPCPPTAISCPPRAPTPGLERAVPMGAMRCQLLLAHVAALLSANAGLDEVDMRSNMLSPELVEAFGGRFGDRVNCRWQQEPPKAEEREVGVARRAKVASEMASNGGVQLVGKPSAFQSGPGALANAVRS